ncbi:annulin-like [Haliotis cracherodii]|uniref:annulin-like n=1 Tax=Haliotis cracherodii TaxID=6455 RepID=UPI0039EBAAA0
MFRRYGGNTPRTSTSRPRVIPSDDSVYPTYSYGRRRARVWDRDRVFWGPNDIRLYCDSDEDENEEECISEVVAPLLETKLHVTHVDLHVPDNTAAHHTDLYECTGDRVSDGTEHKARLVLRRGQEFKMTLHFDRPYDIPKNDITLTFHLEGSYKAARTTSATIKVDESGYTSFDKKTWGASVVRQEDKSLTLSVFAPAYIPVGEWDFSVTTIVDVEDGEDLIWEYKHNEQIYIIFNPWCKDDWVYLEHEDWMKEALLSDSGVLYFGSPSRVGARPWCFGQFDDGILDAALHLIRKGFGYEASSAMGDAAKVARILAKLVNAPDDDGVVMGNWTGEYEGGTSPSTWVGSVKILREYMSTAKPVKFGQCWVFAGVLTTVCRALGMPCRNITNFSSAHNTDADHLSIDRINVKDENGEWTDISNDSVWNFHVWNEVWMSRPDLSDTNHYDGWQVIDATPQETSYDGVFTCGPCPVKAIKEGDINVGSDGAFIFCEVNADTVEWTKDEKTGMLVETKRIPNSIGLCMSTHIPNGRSFRGETMGSLNCVRDRLERLDVTDEYKYREGSTRERTVVRKAEMMFRRAAAYRSGFESNRKKAAMETISVELEQEEDIFVGNGFEFVVTVRNSGNAARTVKQLVVKVYYKTYFDIYTGIAGVRRFEAFPVDGGDAVSYRIVVNEERAAKRPQDGFYFEIKALAELSDASTVVTSTMDFRLRRPDMEIEGPASCRRSETIELQVTFTNPLKVALTNCQVDIEGGFKFVKPSMDKFLIPNIGPGQKWRETLTVVPKPRPKDKDERALTIGLHCKQLADISGHYTVNIDKGYF